MATDNNVGVHVTLREIYDGVMMTAKTADGARTDIDRLRGDVQQLAGRVATVERELKNNAAPAYLKRTGAVIGLLAAGVASGWAAFKGG